MFVFEFHKNQMSDDIIVTSFKVSLFKCPTEPTNIIFSTNIQQHKIHLVIEVQVTLTKAEGQR